MHASGLYYLSANPLLHSGRRTTHAPRHPRHAQRCCRQYHLVAWRVSRAPGFIGHPKLCPRDRSVLLCTRWRHKQHGLELARCCTCARVGVQVGRAFVRQARHLIGKLTCTSAMGLCASHAHRPAQDRGTHPLLACAPVSMVAGPRQTALRTFTGAVTAIAKTFKANDVSRHDLANLTQEVLVSQLGFSVFTAKKILAVRATLEQ